MTGELQIDDIDVVAKPKVNCVLGVESVSGRIKWCPNCRYIKVMLLLPAIMLPIIVFIILSMQLNLAQGLRLLSASGAYHIADNESVDLRAIPAPAKPDSYQRNCPRVRVRHMPSESFDIHEKEIFKDVRTSFIPAEKNRRLHENVWCLADSDSSSQHPPSDLIKNHDTISDLKLSRTINFNQNDENSALGASHRRHRRTTVNQNETQQTNENYTANKDDSDEAHSDEQHNSIAMARDDRRADVPAVLLPFWKGEVTSQQIRSSQMEVMKQYMDLNAHPCVDFYQYACGNWEKLNSIPRDKAGYDTFEILRESLDVVLSNVLTEKYNSNDNDNDNDNDSSESESDKASHTAASEGHDVVVNKYVRVLDMGNNSLDTSRINQEQVAPLQVLNHSSTPNSVKKRSRSVTDYIRLKRSPNNGSYVSTAELKAKQLYESCMNDEILLKRGIEPLLNLLKSLGGFPALEEYWQADQFDWIQLAGQLRLYNNDVFIMQWVGPDIKNSDEYVIQFDQTSLGLPTRDYFLQPSNLPYLEAYEEYAKNIITLLGGSREKSAKVANEIVEFETSLARIMAAPEDRANVSQLYNRMTIEALHQSVAEIDWTRYLEIVLERKINSSETVVMFATKFMQDLVLLLNRTETHTIANYMFWKFIRHRINNLDDRFQDAKQQFYMVLIGREQSPPRWKNCVNQVNSNMGMAVGAMFVRRFFDEQSKQDTLAMTQELQESFRQILNETTWIDAHTKNLAELKVNSMSLKIGYPDFILNPKELDAKYETLEINSTEYFENVLRILVHLTRTEQSKLSEVVNKTAWNTAPAIVNAYYSRNKNQIMFPAGILQPPFYHRHFPRSLNFGGIGVVIGHELTHGFDDKGRLFDRDGNLNRWWSDKSIEGFHQRAHCLITQYGNYTMSEIGGLAIDGSITQGENIADNGGIKQAFRAYQKWLTNSCHSVECLEQERMPGIDLDHLQLFFLNFAQVWCGAMRPEATKNKMKTAVHSPGRFRVIGKLKMLLLLLLYLQSA